MSLHSQPIGEIPEETVRIARAAFPKKNIYMQMRDELGTFYEDEDFQALFPRRGQPAETPWRLALILVMQFIEGLSDRQAADAVRARIDWKYALSLELTDPGFDYSILSSVPRSLTGWWRRSFATRQNAGEVQSQGVFESPRQTAHRFDARACGSAET